jgi:hypothetical protein
LFGDFSTAVAADIPGFARTTLAPRFRFARRPSPTPPGLDYQTLFQRLASKYGRPFPSPVRFSTFPVTGTEATGSMVQGTMAFYNLVTTSVTAPSIGVVFRSGTGGTFPTLLRAQVGIVRVE